MMQGDFFVPYQVKGIYPWSMMFSWKDCLKFVDLFVVVVGCEASLQKLLTEKHQFIHQ